MIDTQAIRNKVLHLAMHGQLTKQLPEDGTAEELYQQIQEERKRQEKDGTIKHAELASDVDDISHPFNIPTSWKWTKLGNVSYIVRGGSPRPIKQYITTREDGINWIKIGDVEKGGKYIYSTHEKIIPEGEAKSRRVYPGDFLLTNSMSFGRPYISQIEGCIHDGWLLIHDLKGFDPNYLYYLLSSSYLYSQFTVKASGSTVDNLNIDKVKSAIIPLPPLAEQQRIVERVDQAFSILDTIDELQSKYSDNLFVLKSKLIDAAIKGKLTEQLSEDGTAEELYQQIQEEKQQLIKVGKIKKEKLLPEIKNAETPFEIPDNWKWVYLNSITSKISSGSTPSGGKKSDAYVPKGFPFFREQNVYKDGIHKEGMVYISEELLNTRPNSTVLANDILLNITGGSIGRCALIPDEFDRGSINQHILIIRPIEPETRFYIHLLICSPYIQNYIKDKAVGDKDGFSGGRCKKILVPLPPLAEQQRIVARLNEVLKMIEA